MKYSGKGKIEHIIFWSVISAAFIGPGTVTTALKAGASFDLKLLWAIPFSIVACIVLQEAASRITISSGLSLGKAIQMNYNSNKKLNINFLLATAVIFGCIAYQAGNLTGALQGIKLVFNIPTPFILLVMYILAISIMWHGKLMLITKTLGILVGLLTIIFLIMAGMSEISIYKMIRALFTPAIPNGSSLLILGLIGTTIVPYNLFLGSGLSKNRNLKDTRFGLSFAILIGGIITASILISGTLIIGEFSFISAQASLVNNLGRWSSFLFAFGLFAAGFTSSVTAPLAAAETGFSLFKTDSNLSYRKSTKYRFLWLFVMTIGLAFSLMNLKPVYLIIMAQAINGLILPFVAISLLKILNNNRIIPKAYQNNNWQNILMIVIIGITILIGCFHFLNVLSGSIGIIVSENKLIFAALIVTVLIVLYLSVFTFRKSIDKIS